MEIETEEILLEKEKKKEEKKLTHLSGKYLTFVIDDQECGIEISKVREIIGIMPISPVPQTPEYVEGVINLRGKVIPVVDLRKKFNLPEKGSTEQTCITVLEITSNTRTFHTGIIVDSVSEVIDIEENQLEATPYFGNGIKTNFILAIAKIQESVKILLDIDEVLYSDELSELSKTETQINNN